MRAIFFTLIICFANYASDCTGIYESDAFTKFKLNKEFDLGYLTSNRSKANLKTYLRRKKISYRSVKFEKEDVIELTGNDSSQLAKLVNHAKLYDTRIFIDPKLEGQGILGFFNVNEDFQRFIFLSPTEVFIKSTQSYDTVLHELRHARYDFLKEIRVDSFYHGELHALKNSDNLMLKDHQIRGYEKFQSLEELPIHIKDLHSEILSLKKQIGIKPNELLRLKENTLATQELHERIIKRMPSKLDKINDIDAINDGEIISISIKLKDINIILYTPDQRLMRLGEIKLNKKNLSIIKSVAQRKVSRLREQSIKIVSSLKKINAKIANLSLKKPRNYIVNELDQILDLNKENLRLIRE